MQRASAFVACASPRENPRVAAQFGEGVRTLVAGGKPVAVTGFGASTYRGAGAGMPWEPKAALTAVAECYRS